MTRARIVRFEAALRSCVEAEGERILVDRDRILLHAEREFHPTDAVSRIGRAEDLLFLLPIVVAQPWLADDLNDRRVQLVRTEQLIDWMLRLRLFDEYQASCQLLEVRGALYRAKRERLRASRVIAADAAARA